MIKSINFDAKCTKTLLAAGPCFDAVEALTVLPEPCSWISWKGEEQDGEKGKERTKEKGEGNGGSGEGENRKRKEKIRWGGHRLI